ncbi:MAG: FAD-dependent oxidoreductase [Silicimonas sp.]|nr:FAD-dependent oxidoreductase [Silicimonas sp.]
MTALPHLFSPIRIGPIDIPNRIVSTGHHTHLASGAPSPELIAYHQARARGGTGLIVTEIVSVHESGALFPNLLTADPANLSAFAELADAVKAEGSRIFAQLFHPGREVMFTTDGMAAVAFAPSAIPNERFHVMPREMPADLIADIIKGYGRAAAFMSEAGYDGVEIVASHGYLPAQFLSPLVNRREDDWGGDTDRRMRFARHIISAVRGAAPDLALGLRLSGDDMDGTGLDSNDVLEIATALAPGLDYLSVTAGTSASLGGSVHITPPMGVEHGYTAPLAKAIRSQIDTPVIVTGRINQPQIAEGILADGSADLCGMTRALITDPEMPRKSRAGEIDAIRACIGCNQSCIGRAHKGFGISCIQRPETGRELQFGAPTLARTRKKVIVVGGGPGGMKSAAVSAMRGHQTELWEASQHLGGQALLAQKLPGREEFGGIIDNLEREIPPGVTMRLGTKATAIALTEAEPDCIVIATGATPFVPEFELSEVANVATAWDVLTGAPTQGSVVIADWKADWIGIGLAEKLARDGASVRLCVNAAMAGETLQVYTRNHYVGRLYRLGVTMKTHLRLFGADADTAYFQNVLTGEPVIEENCGTLVLSLGHQPCDNLRDELEDAPFAVHVIGDALAARTAEEAIYEGMKVAWAI